MRSVPLFLGQCLTLLLAPGVLSATHYTVTSDADFDTLPSTLSPGDTVEIAAGTYTAIRETFRGAGTPDAPIRIYANPLGGARFEGKSGFTLDGSHITVAGLVFDGKGLPGSTRGVFEFESNASHCRVTNCLIRDFDVGEDYANWIYIAGFHNRLDHCHIEGKVSGNTTIFIKPDDGNEPGPEVPRRHRIDHNYFGPRTEIGDNGFECIRLSDSQRQGYHLATVVEHNYFFRTIQHLGASEMEVISNKSKGNIFRYNTFRDNDGQLTLRHGDACLVEGNFFFGTGFNRESGVRIIGEDHIVRNNYFERIGGSNLRAALVLMRGDNNWPASDDSNGYETPHNALIANNTFVNCEQPINLGENKSDGDVPTGTRVLNNLVVSGAFQGESLRLQIAASAIEFGGNILYHAGDNYGTTGLSGVTYGTDPQLLETPELGYRLPDLDSIAINGGVTVDPPTLGDLAGQSRQDGMTDVGAVELGASGLVLNRPLEDADVGPAFGGGPAASFVLPNLSDAAPQFQHTYLDDAARGKVFAATLAAEGGDTPLSYALESGILPPGLTLDANGVLHGTPDTDGFYAFSIEVTDVDGDTDRATFSLTVREIDRLPSILSDELPSAQVDTAYDVTLLASDGDAPLTWSVSSGTLPPGIELETTGQLHGSPTLAGIYDFELTVEDADGDAAPARFFLGVTHPQASVGAFTESDGELVMEAEHFTDQTDAGSHRWEVVTHATASGESTNNAIQAIPTTGSRVNTPGEGPSVAFRVLIQTPGDYIVHVRGTGADGSSDSVFVGVDGSTSDFRSLSLSTAGWIWKRDSDRFTLSEGLHTVNLWMREPGAIIDKVVLNQSSTVPTGLGPPAQPKPLLSLTFAQWKLDHFGTTEVALSLDDEPDGYTLLEEYLWDLDPRSKDPTGARPRGILEDGKLTLSLAHQERSTDIGLKVTASPDLNTWSEVIFDLATDEMPAMENERIKISDTATSASDPRFLRIEYVIEAE